MGRNKGLNSYPEELTINDAKVCDEHNKYMFKINIQYSCRAHKTDYTLSAMIVHIGSALEGGHYIAYVLVHGQWFEVN